MEIKTYTPAVERAGVDEGLRAYMLKVYNYMAGGLILTALSAFVTLNTPLFNLFFSQTGLTALGWVVFLAPLLLIFVFNGVVMRGTVGQVQAVFWGYSALMGASLAPVMLIYTAASMTRVFLITAATFGAMSIYGYTTKRDLTKIGSFMIMGLWGLIIASIVNIFLKSEAMYYILSYVAVVIFVALTAYDTQKIRSFYTSYDAEDMVTRRAISGALALYLDFINLFLYLLRIMGDRR